ncbi:MAG: formimidoylglutamate deiminase [Lysobacterales bacterium]|jgi:formimidoylglutamate deiminase
MAATRIYCRQALLVDGWRNDVLLEVDSNGLIGSISSGLPGSADVQLCGTVIPGMPNVHSHGFQRMISGLTGGGAESTGNFWGWREAMYRFANKITSEQLEVCMAWVYAEMLMAGYTACAEFHYLHHQPDGGAYSQRAETSLRILSAADSSGIAVTLLPVLYSVSGFGQMSTGHEQRRFSNKLDEYLEILQTCRKAIDGQSLHCLGIAPHSLRAVHSEELKNLLESISTERMPIHIHIAEQAAEVEASKEYLGARPVEWLLNNVALDQNWCLVHATHMLESERLDAAATGVVAGLCPTTEADLGDGFFDTAAWLREGGRFGIGSDSNLRISVSDELRMLEYSERLRQERRNILCTDFQSCGRFLYEHAATSGAQALGQHCGVIETGRRADLVELDNSHPLLVGRQEDAILDSLVFAGGREMNRTVYVAGKRLVEDGQHINETALKAGFSRVMKELLS